MTPNTGLRLFYLTDWIDNKHMGRKRFYWCIVLFMTLGIMTTKGQNKSLSDLLIDVAEICGTGNHGSADCQLIRQGANVFGIVSLDSLANMLEENVLDRGNMQTIAVLNDLLSYSEQHFGQVSQEAVVCRRRLVSAWWAKDWEKARQLAEENENCSASLFKKQPKNKSIKLLSITTQLELLTILKNRNQDNPEHWAKIIQIEKELEPYLTGKITYTSDLVDCCQMMANYKAGSSTWSEYVNRLIHESFPDGTYLEGALDGNDMFSNAPAFMLHAFEGAAALWNEHDLRRINVASDLAALQMRNKLEEYDTLHDKYVKWHTFLLEYLPKGDPMPDQIQLLMWECDVRYGQNLYEVRSPYPMLYRFEAFYGKDSFAYQMMMFNLTSITMMVNMENGKQLLKELQTIVDEQCEPDSDLYGSYLMAMYWCIQTLSGQSPIEYKEFLNRLTVWYEKNHRASWESIYNGKQIANIYSTSLSLPDKAAELFNIVKNDASNIVVKESVLFTSVLENLVSCQELSSNHDTKIQAIENCEDLISIHERMKCPSARDFMMLSNLQLYLGEKDNAIQTLRTGIIKSTLAEDGLWRCLLQLSLGWNLYSTMGVSLQEEPKQLFEEAIPFFKENVEKVGGAYIEGFSLISYYYNAIGEYDKAERTLKEGMELHETLYGEYDYLYMQMLSDLYTLYAQNLNEYDKAEQLLEGRLEIIRQNTSFSMHGVILQLLWNRYHLLSSKTDDWMLRFTALNEIQAEITLMAQLAGDDASQLKNIAMPVIYEYANMFPLLSRLTKEADRLYDQKDPSVTDEQMTALRQMTPTLHQAAKENMLPEMLNAENNLKELGQSYLENYETLNLYTALANYYIGIEQDTIKAESYYIQLSNSTQPIIRIKALAELANLSMQQGFYEQAAKYYEELKHEADNTPQAIVSLEDQAGYCNAMGSAYIMCGRYKDAIPSARDYFKFRQQQVAQNFDYLTQSEREAFIRNGGDGGGGILLLLPKFPKILATEGYNAILASKGLLLRASERIKRGIMHSGNKELQVLTDSLNQLTTRFKTMNTMTDWVHGNYNYDPEVVKTRQQIEMLERNINREASKYIEGINTPNWQQLQMVLNQGEAAVEYVLSDSTSLGALVLLPQGNPSYVPLTSANELWTAMAGMADMDSYQKIEAMYVQDQLHLYDKLWMPIETMLQGVKAVYFSPTGFLNDLAFSAFKCTDGSYLSDKYELHQMLSTGNLIDLRTSGEKNVVRTASLYGSVFYSPEQEKEAECIEEEKSKKNRGALVDEFEFLPFTKREVVDVGSLMNSKLVRVNIFEGFSSTEESVRSISEHSPDVLHLSTHGFFIKGDKNMMDNKFLSRFPAIRFSSMQRSGLAFVGANRTWEGDTDKPEESDGILTANEVALLDLSKTRLTVLSACKTAVGEYTLEGVYGMHRGFKQAGVKSILATLWNVNDKSTARLMELFYDRWLSGVPMQQSLNEAVRELRKDYPSPFYWAPFVLMDAEN